MNCDDEVAIGTSATYCIFNFHERFHLMLSRFCLVTNSFWHIFDFLTIPWQPLSPLQSSCGMYLRVCLGFFDISKSHMHHALSSVFPCLSLFPLMDGQAKRWYFCLLEPLLCSRTFRFVFSSHFLNYSSSSLCGFGQNLLLLFQPWNVLHYF